MALEPDCRLAFGLGGDRLVAVVDRFLNQGRNAARVFLLGNVATGEGADGPAAGDGALLMVLMALHKTHKQMLRAGLSEQAQLRLDRLIHHERHRREHAIGHEFAPIIGRAPWSLMSIVTASSGMSSRSEPTSRSRNR